MKTVKIILSGCLIALCSFSFAAGDDKAKVVKTDLSKNWTCTTNASSSDKESDKKADENLAKNKGSIKKSFSAAEKNCRDCTKISCEMSS